MTQTPTNPELATGYTKVRLNYAPKTNGKKFAKWCEDNGFTPIGSGRRAWSSSLGTYLRDASGIAYADGEPFLFYEEDLVDIDKLLEKEALKARQNEVESLMHKDMKLYNNRVMQMRLEQLTAQLEQLGSK